ncbi:motility associated factor glycosyltransferase family protein [Clostridium fallax]|uniref:Uncharacterized conserved protein n=1 Tax=Clostridium fallax TaxID=1533 RepID=A0A1M4ULH4_9CLOT|nr:6-hydroxymethylpterin diphosphokinase MptE-like protein [Clostridium fallax]SHE57524.1 Uncharacterized conserved protein [Clostridium fallax]SQB07628.1 putative transmembrane anchored MAF_flag10 domain protein [Clostridium fallax]
MKNDNYIMEFSKDNFPILKANINNKLVYLGSKYNEKKNIESFIKSLNIKDGEDYIVIIGLALGSYLKDLIDIATNNNILIIEPDENIYSINKENKETNKILKNKNINYILYKNDEEFSEKIKSLIDISFNKTYAFSIYTNYENTFKEKCVKIVNCINNHLNYINLLRNSNIYLGEQTLKNYVNNFKHIGNNLSAYDFNNLFENKTAVIVSAGPSLSKNIKYLKEYKDKVVIIAVARSLNELLMNDIKPDFICAIDPGNIMFELLEKNINSEIPLVCIDQVNSKLIENYKGKKIFVLNMFKETISKLLNKKFISLPNGGSVAHLATSFALFMGIKNVIFIGQDLAYTDMKYHSDNSSSEKLRFEENSWKNTDIDKSTFIYVEGNEEELVPTNKVFITFKNWFEDFIKANNTIKFINSTEGGAKINGTIKLSIKDALRDYSEKNINVSKTIKNKINNIQENKINLIENIKKDIINILNLCRKAKQLSIEMKNVYKYNKGNLNDILRKLDNIDIRINKNKELFSLLNLAAYEELEALQMNKEYRTKIKESEIEKQNRICERNIKIYDIYIKSLEKILLYIKEYDKEEIYG